MTVELLYDEKCPNVAEARANLRRALIEVGLPPSWTERMPVAPEAPYPLRGFGSPTVLVDGRDVAHAEPADAACCRVYEVAGRWSGAPPGELIGRALRATMEPQRPGRWRAALVLPAMGAALVPGLTCPACWPAYAAALSALGLPFIPTAAYLLPVTAGLLLAAIAALALPRETRVPFVVGLAASVLVLLGKFMFDSSTMTYAGVSLLVAASLPSLRRRGAATCPACAPESVWQGTAATQSTEGR